MRFWRGVALSFLERVFVSMSTYLWCAGTVGLQGIRRG